MSQSPPPPRPGFFRRLWARVLGRASGPETYAVARRVFAHGLGLIFFFAFLSLAVQMRGLFGQHGIAPAADFLREVHEQIPPATAYHQLPTVFWLTGASDAALLAVTWIGVTVALILAAGFLPGPCVLVLWVLYLSLNCIGNPFLNFQWDALLLETALPAAVFLPWRLLPRWRQTTRVTSLGRYLLWWLIGRLMLESAIVKLSSGDPTWHDLTAMTYHYQTQPLPLWTAWYAHKAPLWVHQGEAIATFVIEFLAPALLLVPWRRARQVAAGLMILLQAAIASTGNYAFFNLLTALLCVPLLDDRFFPASWRAFLRVPWREWRTGARPEIAVTHLPRAGWAANVLVVPALLAVSITAASLLGTLPSSVRLPLFGTVRLAEAVPAPVTALSEAVAPSRSFNAYGLFAVMTTERREIEIQGSNDGINWHAYEFRWKPGNPRRRPELCAPHQPRLDWQMWFAALGSYRQNPWLLNCAVRLLEGRPDVLGLLEWNPFPSAPPKYIRAVVYRYQFSDGSNPSDWWTREELGLYFPPFSLKEVSSASDHKRTE